MQMIMERLDDAGIAQGGGYLGALGRKASGQALAHPRDFQEVTAIVGP